MQLVKLPNGAWVHPVHVTAISPFNFRGEVKAVVHFGIHGCETVECHPDSLQSVCDSIAHTINRELSGVVEDA